MADLPEAGHDLSLGVRRQFRQQFGHHVPRICLLEQPGPQVDEQPGPVLRSQLSFLGADPVQYRERSPPQPRGAAACRTDQLGCRPGRSPHPQPGRDLRLAVLRVAAGQGSQQAGRAVPAAAAEDGHMPALRPEPAMHAPDAER